MFCIHHVTLVGYMFKHQCKLKILTDVSPEVLPRHLQTHAILSGNLQKFFSIVLKKPVWNLYACNFAHVTSTHAVNVSARLLWMDFTVCSMIHNSRHQHERHEQQLPNSWNLHISIHVVQLHTTLCLLSCTVDVYRRVCHTWMTFRHVNRTVQWRQNVLSRFCGPSLDM